MHASLPIGVFDSGIGGLTLIKTLRQFLPQEDLLYLGDTARLPYGTKTPQTVCHYAKAASQILVGRGIKLLVIACNTASAVALPTLQELFHPVPVIGVIEPASFSAAAQSRQGNIAVIATERTVASGAYREALYNLNPNLQVTEKACSLLVALAEEGWVEGALVEAIVRQQIAQLWEVTSAVPDCLILGCTHFPVLREAIEAILPKDAGIQIVDPAIETAHLVARMLAEKELSRDPSHQGHTHFMATDGLGRFARIATTFLCSPIDQEALELIDL